MGDIWEILGIKPSRDAAAIKKAYARQTHRYHPEEDPEMFLQLRKAYQTAMEYCDSFQGQERASEEQYKKGDDISGSAREQECTSEGQYKKSDDISGSVREQECTSKEQFKESDDTSGSFREQGQTSEYNGWQIVAEEQELSDNPYIGHEAHRQFLILYTGNQRKNPKLWMDYFTSPAFLEVYRESAFTALLLAEVEQHAQDAPPGREFLTWLHIAYLLTSQETGDLSGGRERRFHMQDTAFDGIESIFQIAVKGPVPKQFAGNEYAMFISFSEYRYLMRIAEEGNWNDEMFTVVRGIVERYVLAYIKEKCTQKGESKERHPAGLRLLNDFFGRQRLPDELYRILWERLSLKTATMGRTKIFYGRLREIVLERIPEIEAEEENFSQLYQDDILYFNECGKDPQRDIEMTDAFFEREDVQKALRSRRFVEGYLLNIWMTDNRCVPFLEKIKDFYSENTNAPCAGRAVALAEWLLQQKTTERQLEEDQSADVSEECMTFRSRPFFRHWINTGFYMAEDPESGQSLLGYLSSCLPYLPDWSRRFAETGKRETIVLGGHTIEVVFHLRYMEYRVDARSVYQPFLHWDTLLERLREDDRSLFLLLPVTAAPFDQYAAVRSELSRRLGKTAAPERDRLVIAGFLAGYICCLPVSGRAQNTGELMIAQQEARMAFPLELFAENGEHLYGCSWYCQRGVLTFFEQTFQGRRDLPRNYYEGVCEEEAAVSMARRVLQELASPVGFDLSLLQRLPGTICVQPQYAPAETLEREAVNEEMLGALIFRYAQGSLRRLQLMWSEGSLVFLSDRNAYACLYFDDLWETCYILLSMPEVYRAVEDGRVHYIPFGLGKLPDYGIHHNTESIISRLNKVFGQMGRGQSVAMRAGDQLLWAIGNSGNRNHQRYLAAKQKIGGFPAEQVQNYILAKFVLSRYPQQIGIETTDQKNSVIKIDSTNTDEVKLALVEYMQNKLRLLRLSWVPETEGQAWYPFHIVLLQEDKRYMMVCLRDDTKQAEYYVADVGTYMDVKGKKYPKDTFMGRITPAYLIHSDAEKIRNCLDLIFDDMGDLPAIMGQFAAFASEKPVKARTYEEIRDDLVH